MAKEFALDIFQLLGKIDKGDKAIWPTLTEEQRKSFAPLIAMRWMSGTSDARQIVFLNELVNPMVFTIGSHKELMMQLLAVASSKQPKRYQWMAVKNATKKHKGYDVVSEYYGYGDRDTKEALKVLTTEDILEMAEELGYQKEELAKLRKDLK
jgi:hypothetical protein